MDPVQALILKLMESRAGQDRNAMNPTSDPGGLQGAQPQPGQAQAAPMGDFEQYGAHMPQGNPEDLIAQLLGGMQGGPPQR